MLIGYKRGQGSVVLRIKILNSSVSTGAGLTGLTSASSGLIISSIADNEAAATAYTVAGATIETITTLGTYAAPTATKCRFKEVDATNHKGVYEIHIADARFAVSSAKSLLVSISGATNAVECDVVVPLRDLDPYDAVRAGLTAIPNVASGSAGAIITSGTGTAQLSVSTGIAQADVARWLGTAVSTPTVAGVPNVNAKTWNDLTTVALPLIPTTAGRTLDVSVGGEAGVDWANVGSPTTALALTGTTIATTQQVDVNTIKTQVVTCGAGVTVLASVGTAATNTAQTGDNFARLGAPAGASVSADVAAVKADTAAVKVKTDFLPSVTAGAAGGVFIAGTNAATTVTTAFTTTFTGNLTGSVASVTGAVGSVTGLTASNLDATVSSRMATYAQPTGFLAATFPVTVASTTNITAGTITTVTAVTGLTASNLDATVSSRATPAQVNTEVLDVIAVDTTTQPASVLSATPTIKEILQWLGALSRNKRTQSTNTETLYADDGSTVVATSAKSDASSLFTRGEWM